jgi:ABC-type multidrug transport system fused ATPase/permease subunit
MENNKRKWTSLSGSLKVFKYIQPYWFSFFIGIVLLSVSGLLVITITALLGLLMTPGDMSTVPGGQWTQQFLQLYFNGEVFSTTKGVLIALVFLLLVQGIFSFLRVYLFAYVTENAMLELRSDAFKKMISKPMSFYHENRVGDLVTRISSDITSVQETLTMTLAEFIRQLVIIVVGVISLVRFSGELTLVMLSSLPVIIVVMVFFGRFIRKLGKQTQDKVAESGVIVNESLTGIVNVKSFAGEVFEWKRFRASAEKVKSFGMKGAVWRGMFGTFIIIFLFGALGLVIGWGSYLQQKGEIPSEVLPQFIMLTGLVAGSIGGLASQMGSLQKGLGTIETIMSMISSDSENIAWDENEKTTAPTSSNIRFVDVTFSYPSRPEINVLHEFSLTLEEGKSTALVGQSGSGKSTLASLILRLFEPNSGKIFWGNELATNFNLTTIREQIAFVPQEIMLFGGSIRENILYGNQEINEEEFQKVVEESNVSEFVKELPEGLNTLVGERGTQLSGGQRQRIAIARAMIKNPRVLILDEATSALDTHMEKQVQQALNRLTQGRTSIVIAHRLSTVRNCDNIVVLEKGRILESGTHEQLWNKINGIYKGMVELQQIQEV